MKCKQQQQQVLMETMFVDGCSVKELDPKSRDPGINPHSPANSFHTFVLCPPSSYGYLGPRSKGGLTVTSVIELSLPGGKLSSQIIAAAGPAVTVLSMYATKWLPILAAVSSVYLTMLNL